MNDSPIRAIVAGAAILLAGLFAAPAAAAITRVGTASAGIAGTGLLAVPDSVRPTSDVTSGGFASREMSVEIALAPRNEALLSGLLTNLYDPGSPLYEHWLAAGKFEENFAPSAAEAAAVGAYLRAYGLVVTPSASPFLIRATGTSGAVSSAFHTSLRTYRTSQGRTYFANASPVLLPAAIAQGVFGVIGLTNTVRLQPLFKRAADRSASALSGCEAPYPTAKQFFAAVNDGVLFPFGYGGGPGCNGLTPSQANSIYSAPNVGPRGKGANVTLGLFELSAYRHSDIDEWAHTFYGKTFTPHLVDVDVDGGPLNVKCPSGDTCPPASEGYAGDIEVDADIEIQLAISPDAERTIVYNAPNDDSGQTTIDELTKIAKDDAADVVSSSWGECESLVGAGLAKAENVVFEQLALQGQSMFAAAGDDGAFDCDGDNGTTSISIDDPGAQPWVTSVGGTSFESFNPGTDAHPVRPAGVETVWNVDELCNTRVAGNDEGGFNGLFWCGETGAGGGGNSIYWGKPYYQEGPGIGTTYETHGNGTTQCSLAVKGTPCRVTPDVSADADEYTPYAEYCTGDAATVNSNCATFSGSQMPPGWFGIGGTSLSSPLWSAIFADRDSFQGVRTGNANPLLYLMYNANANAYFHDINAKGHGVDNNGFFPTEPGYDQATGIGTPKMSAIITGFPQR